MSNIHQRRANGDLTGNDVWWYGEQLTDGRWMAERVDNGTDETVRRLIEKMTQKEQHTEGTM